MIRAVGAWAAITVGSAALGLGGWWLYAVAGPWLRGER